jgi:hypothetical protein
LNRDFVEKNFDQMRGVFTLGEKEKDTEDKIKAAKEDKDKEQEKLNNLRRTLGGNDGTGGKKGELAQLEGDARDKFWVPVEKIKKGKSWIRRWKVSWATRRSVKRRFYKKHRTIERR